MIEVYATRIPAGNKLSRLTSLLSFMQGKKGKRIRNFYHKEDAARALAGEWLARTVISKKLNIPLENIRFKTNANGKPYLLGRNKIHFNISHSGKWAVCAFGEKPAGIDIEEISTVNLEIARRFFSAEECFDLFSKKADERLLFFYELWTLKESFIKAAGKGLSIPLSSFTIKISSQRSPTGCRQISDTVGNPCMIQGISTDSRSNNKKRGSNILPDISKYNFRQYSIDKNYKMAVCSTESSFSPDIVKLQMV